MVVQLYRIRASPTKHHHVLWAKVCNYGAAFCATEEDVYLAIWWVRCCARLVGHSEKARGVDASSIMKGVSLKPNGKLGEAVWSDVSRRFRNSFLVPRNWKVRRTGGRKQCIETCQRLQKPCALAAAACVPKRQRLPHHTSIPASLRVQLALICTALIVARGYANCDHEGYDLSDVPPFWCTLNATVWVDETCSTRVVEHLRIPWGIGQDERIVIMPKHQAIDPDSIIFAAWFSQLETAIADKFKLSIDKKHASYDVYTITFYPPRSTTSDKSHSYRLQYTVLNGVEQYGVCANDTFVPKPDDEVEHFISWGPGNATIQEIREISVFFAADPNSRRRVVNTHIQAPHGEEWKTENVSGHGTFGVGFSSRSHSGSLSSLRFGASLGYETATEPVCPSSRNCESEWLSMTAVIREKSGLTVGQIVGITVGVCLLLVACVAIWMVRAHYRVAEEQVAAEMEGGSPKASVPSLHKHMYYDTGDEDEAAKIESTIASLAGSPTRRPDSAEITFSDDLDIESGFECGEDGPLSGGLSNLDSSSSRQAGMNGQSASPRWSRSAHSVSHLEEPGSTHSYRNGESPRSQGKISRNAPEKACVEVSAKSLLRDDFETTELHSSVAPKSLNGPKSVNGPRSLGALKYLNGPKSLNGPRSLGSARSPGVSLSAEDTRAKRVGPQNCEADRDDERGESRPSDAAKDARSSDDDT